MRALTNAARAICYTTAVAIDRARNAPNAAARRAADERAALLTPVAKAFSSDIGSEVASLGIQVHGGMGYIEETGVAQFYRDVRVAQIYEGTNGIQAIDLVTRKLPMAGGEALATFLTELRRTAVKRSNDPAFGATGARFDEAITSLKRASAWLVAKLDDEPEAALAGATPHLRLFARLCGFDAQCPRTRGMCEGRLCLCVAKPSRKFSVRGPVSAGKFRRLVFGGAEMRRWVPRARLPRQVALSEGGLSEQAQMRCADRPRRREYLAATA